MSVTVTMTDGQNPAARSSSHRRPGAPTPGMPIELETAISGILRSLIIAKQFMDSETVRLVEVYSKDEILRSLVVPAFSMAEVNLDLRFVIDKVETENIEGKQSSKVHVRIDSQSLAGLPPNAISEFKIKIVPSNFKVYDVEGKKVVSPE
jgi:hypothetical protein